MLLNTAQLQMLKAWVIANAQSRFEESTLTLLHANAAPDYWCWRTAVEKKEIVQQPSVDATSFVWTGNGFITRSVQEIECWNQLFNSTLICNPSLTNVRQAFSDIFSGTGNAALNRTHLLATCRRRATVAEKLLAVVATGPGNTGGQPRGSTQNPDAFGVGAEGSVTIQNLVDASNS